MMYTRVPLLLNWLPKNLEDRLFFHQLQFLKSTPKSLHSLIQMAGRRWVLNFFYNIHPEFSFPTTIRNKRDKKVIAHCRASDSDALDSFSGVWISVEQCLEPTSENYHFKLKRLNPCMSIAAANTFFHTNVQTHLVCLLNWKQYPDNFSSYHQLKQLISSSFAHPFFFFLRIWWTMKITSKNCRRKSDPLASLSVLNKSPALDHCIMSNCFVFSYFSWMYFVYHRVCRLHDPLLFKHYLSQLLLYICLYI